MRLSGVKSKFHYADFATNHESRQYKSLEQVNHLGIYPTIQVNSTFYPSTVGKFALEAAITVLKSKDHQFISKSFENRLIFDEVVHVSGG